MLTYLRNFAWGLVMAFGELLPGVGMQTVAIIVGLYDDLITFLFEGTELVKAIGLFIVGRAKKSDIALAWKSISWSFGIPVFGAIAITIVALSRVVGNIFELYPSQVAAVSFGIVVASIMIPFKEMSEKTWKEGLVFLASFAIFFGIFSISRESGNADPSIFVFFVGGLFASIAAFFPGISITLALLLMGLYQPLFASIELLTSKQPTLYSFGAILFFGIGLAIGMLACVRMLSVLIQKYKSLFLAFIIGLIVASARVIWPFRTVALEGISHPIAPWEVPLPIFTQQLLFITIAFIFVSLLRRLAENKGTLGSSFGQKERTVISG